MKVIGMHIPPEIYIFLISIISFFSQAQKKKKPVENGMHRESLNKD